MHDFFDDVGHFLTLQWVHVHVHNVISFFKIENSSTSYSKNSTITIVQLFILLLSDQEKIFSSIISMDCANQRAVLHTLTIPPPPFSNSFFCFCCQSQRRFFSSIMIWNRNRKCMQFSKHKIKCYEWFFVTVAIFSHGCGVSST